VDSLGNKSRTFTCCGRNTIEHGCSLGPHVEQVSSYCEMVTIGIQFVKTNSRPSNKPIIGNQLMFALDCEMVKLLLLLLLFDYFYSVIQ
jgi:hypothetical protein